MASLAHFSGRDAVAAIVKGTPELFEFLRCDVTLPDAKQQANDGAGVRTDATVMRFHLQEP